MSLLKNLGLLLLTVMLLVAWVLLPWQGALLLAVLLLRPGARALGAEDGARPAQMLEAVQAAHERDMTVVLLCGRDGGALATLLRETDVQICVPHDRAARVREVHALVLHCLCDGVDAQLLGEQENPI